MSTFMRATPQYESSPGECEPAEVLPETPSLLQQLRHDERIYQHLRQFGALIGKPVKWNLKPAGRLFICECYMGEMVAASGKTLRKKAVIGS